MAAGAASGVSAAFASPIGNNSTTPTELDYLRQGGHVSLGYWLVCYIYCVRMSQLKRHRKVVRRHTEGMMVSIIWVLLQIYFSFQQWKNFENPLRVEKVIVTSFVYYFFGTQCIGNGYTTQDF